MAKLKSNLDIASELIPALDEFGIDFEKRKKEYEISAEQLKERKADLIKVKERFAQIGKEIETIEKDIDSIRKDIEETKKKLEPKEQYIPTFMYFDGFDLPQIIADLNDKSKSFLKRNSEEQLDIIMNRKRRESIEFINFVQKGDESEFT